jgi:hypothetical protein
MENNKLLNSINKLFNSIDKLPKCILIPSFFIYIYVMGIILSYSVLNYTGNGLPLLYMRTISFFIYGFMFAAILDGITHFILKITSKN